MTERFKYRDGRGLMTSIARRARPVRSGSYPLMNMAEDHGVDYGDLLLWTYATGEILAGRTLPIGRYLNGRAAWHRMEEGVGHAKAMDLREALLAYLRRR